MKYFPKISFRTVSVVLLLTLVSILLNPALSLASNFRVAVVPWSVNAPAEFAYLSDALTDMISSRVGSDEMVEIIRKDSVVNLSRKYDLKNLDGKDAMKLAKALNAEFLIFGSVSVLGDSVSLDAKVLNIFSGKITPLFTSGNEVSSIVKMAQTISTGALVDVHMLASTIKPDFTYTGKFKPEEKSADNVVKVKAEVAPGVELGEKASVVISAPGGGDKAPEVVVITRKIGSKTLKRRSIKIDGFYVSMTNADLDGDGTDEIFMIKAGRLIVADFGIEGLKIIKEFEFPSDVQNILLSSGDTDRDGKDEVYIARLKRGVPVSLSVEYKNGSYVVNEIKGLRYLLRVIDIEGEGSRLIAQNFDIKGGFFRKIVKIKKDKDSYKEDGRFNIPKSIARTGLSNFQFIDIDSDGTNEIVTLGKRGKLKIFKADSKGKFKEYYRTPEKYGGSLNELEDMELNTESSSDIKDSYYMNSEIKYGDFDSDGVGEIMVKKNIAGGFGKYAIKTTHYVSGSLTRFFWNVAIYESEWKTKEITGYISDFIISDFDGDGTDEVTMLIVENPGNLLNRDRMHSYLLSYSIM